MKLDQSREGLIFTRRGVTLPNPLAQAGQELTLFEEPKSQGIQVTKSKF